MKQKLRFLMWPAYLTVLFTVAASTLIVEVSAHSGHTHHSSSTLAAVDTHCASAKNVVVITVTATTFIPKQITAHLCDNIIFHNATDGLIDVAMGPHAHHVAYPGLSSAPMSPGDNQTLLLVSKGTFLLHEHLRDVATGTLTILP